MACSSTDVFSDLRSIVSPIFQCSSLATVRPITASPFSIAFAASPSCRSTGAIFVNRSTLLVVGMMVFVAFVTFTVGSMETADEAPTPSVSSTASTAFVEIGCVMLAAMTT